MTMPLRTNAAPYIQRTWCFLQHPAQPIQSTSFSHHLRQESVQMAARDAEKSPEPTRNIIRSLARMNEDP
jgi:hypothetical protein